MSAREAPGTSARSDATGVADLVQRVDHAVDQLTRGAGALEPDAGEPWSPPRLDHVVAAIDGSPASAVVLAWAREVAVATRARVTVVSVVPPSSMYQYALSDLGVSAVPGGPNLFKEEEAAAWDRVERARRALDAAGLEADGEVPVGPAVSHIVRLARERRADLIVLGSHGQGALDRFLLGSVAEGVKNHAPCSVLLARGPPPPVRLVLCTDGSRRSKRAAALGFRLGRAWDVPATLLHVLPTAYSIPEGVRRREEARGTGVDLSWAEPPGQARVAFGPAAGAITAVAREDGASLVVLAHRGLGGLVSLVAGSVAYRVSHQPGASVLLVKDALAAGPRGPGGSGAAAEAAVASPP